MAEIRYFHRMVDGMPVVAAPAEIDITTAEQLRAVLLAAARRGDMTVVVDMTRTRFCHSSGLGALAQAHKQMLAEGGELRLVIPAGGAVFRVFGLTGLGRFIPRFGSLSEALLQRTADPAGTSMPSARLQAEKAVTDVVDLIGGDRARIMELLARIGQLTGSCPDAPGGQAPDAGDGMLRPTWAVLAHLLTAYIDAEHEVCYLTMAAARPPAALRQAWDGGIFDIIEALAEARLSPAGSARWLRAVIDASTAVVRHFQTEDACLLPVLSEAPPETRGLLGRQWAAFTLARLQDDAEADAAGHCRTSFPRRRAWPPFPSPSAARRGYRNWRLRQHARSDHRHRP